MKRWKWLLLAAALVPLIRMEHTGTDIGDLEPVALVRITANEARVRIITDTGAEGTGETLDDAIADLHASASGEIFLDTAQYLLVDENCVDYLPRLYDHLRPTCRICLAQADTDPEAAAKYLQVHRPEATLLHFRAGAAQLQTLYIKEGRGHIE